MMVSLSILWSFSCDCKRLFCVTVTKLMPDDTRSVKLADVVRRDSTKRRLSFFRHMLRKKRPPRSRVYVVGEPNCYSIMSTIYGLITTMCIFYRNISCTHYHHLLSYFILPIASIKCINRLNSELMTMSYNIVWLKWIAVPLKVKSCLVTQIILFLKHKHSKLKIDTWVY